MAQPEPSSANVAKAWLLAGTGTILCVDAHFSELFSLAPSEVLARQFRDLVQEQDEVARWAGGGPARADCVHARTGPRPYYYGVAA